MKTIINLIILIALALLITGCTNFKMSPYGAIESNPDSQIFVYTDVDVEYEGSNVTSDDTTVLIVGVKGGENANITEIFGEALTVIKEIFQERQKVYKKWVK